MCACKGEMGGWEEEEVELLCLPISIQSPPPLFFLSQPYSEKRGDVKVDREAQRNAISVEAFEPSNFKKVSQRSVSGQGGLMGERESPHQFHRQLC